MASGEGRIERRLLCELTDEDAQSRGRMLAETVVQIDVLQAERKATSKVFVDKLAGLGEQQRDLTKAIRDRAEWRIIACAVRFHVPDEGRKEIIRLDTGEVIETVEMTAAEKQMHLFAADELEQSGAPSAEDLDAVASEQAAAEATAMLDGTCMHGTPACESCRIPDDLPAGIRNEVIALRGCGGCGYPHVRCECPGPMEHTPDLDDAGAGAE